MIHGSTQLLAVSASLTEGGTLAATTPELFSVPEFVQKCKRNHVMGKGAWAQGRMERMERIGRIGAWAWADVAAGL